MTAFTFYRDPSRGDPVSTIAVVKEGFAIGALLFGPLWFLNAAAPVSALLDFGASVLVILSQRALAFSPLEVIVALVFWRLLIAFEARNLLRFGLERRGWRFDRVVMAEDIAEAEARYFSRSERNEAASSRDPHAVDLSALAARLDRRSR